MNKCICLKDKEFDFGSSIGGCKFVAKKNEIYEYYMSNGLSNPFYSIKSKGTECEVVGLLYYPILGIYFDDVFSDIIEYRNNKLESIGI